MKKLLLLLLPFACMLAGCKYDDTSLWDEVNAQKAKIATLESTVASMNSNIGSLQSLINAVQSKVTINAVTKTEGGYLIAFSDGNTARINNGVDGKDGKNGQDGTTPVIGAKADSDGNFYWTVNGAWLLDAEGNKVSTSNTPQVKIEDDQWMVSYDNGASWTKVEGQGASATCVFEKVTTDPNNAIFTLGDGTVITVPLTNAAQKLQLVFDEKVFASMRNGELLSTAYTITAPEGAKVDLETFESDGWTVKFYKNDSRTGRISIKAPEKVNPTKILFLLTDDKGGSFIKIINIGLNESGKPVVQTEYTSDYQGGNLTIPIMSSTAEVDADWVKIVSVGDQVVVNVSKNESYDRRSAKVTLEDGTVVTITQVTEDALILSKEVVNIDGRRQLVAFVVNSNIIVKANVTEGSDWLSVSPATRGLTEKIFTFTAKRNKTEAERTATVEFSGNNITKTCTINQAVFEGDPSMDVAEAAASDEGEEIELKTSLMVAVTTDGYVVSGGGSYIFVQDASNAPQWAGDSVKFNATATKFNDLPALGSVSGFTTVSEKNTVKVSGTDITSKINTFNTGVPTAVKVTGDLTIDNSGNYNLTVKGATKRVVIYKPANYTGLASYNGYNINLTGIYYGESDGAINIIAVSFTSNGVTMKEGDDVTVAQFISLARTDIKLKLTGTVSNYNKSNCRFDLTDETGTIYVYTVTNKSEWSNKIKNGGTVTLLGKYQYYEKDKKHEVVDAEIVSFSGGGSSTTVYNYQKATSISSGKSYILVALDGSKAYVGSPITKDFGYINVDEATDNNGVISMPSRSNEYVITSANNGYTIKQSDGKFLYQTGTFNSFNVSTEPADGQYWTISVASDGKATITNTSVNKYVQYSVSHSSYGSYASEQSGALMPCLYEYIGEGQGSGGGGDTPGGDTPGGSGGSISGGKITWDSSDSWSGIGEKVISLTAGDYTITIDKVNGSTNPAVNASANDCRVYAKGTVTITTTGANMTSIVFNISNQGKKRLAPITANTGTLAKQTAGDATVTWSGSAKSVTFTVGEKAVYGSDGETKAGQLCFNSIEIN